MAKIPDTSLRQYSDGEKVYAVDYNSDRNIIKDAINDIEDKLASTADGNSGADNVSITAITGITGGTIQLALEELKAQVNQAIDGYVPDGGVTIEKLDPTIIGSRSYSDNNIIVDNEPVAASLNKLDVRFGKKELQFTEANKIVYVNPTTGVNTPLAGVAGTPYRTIQYAINQLPKKIDHEVIIQLAVGTYLEAVNVNGFTGSGYIKIRGAVGSESSYVITLITFNSWLRAYVEGVTANVAHASFFSKEIARLESRIEVLEGV